MIIDNNMKNNNNNNNNLFNKSLNENKAFSNRFNTLKKDNENFSNNNPFVEDIKSIHYSNPLSRKEMQNKSLAMLQERLDNGLITLDEFNRKCMELSKDKK